MQKEELLAYFIRLVPNGSWKRLGTTFQTENSKYFYDTGTGKVLECEEEEFFVLQNILKNSGISSLEKPGWLTTDYARKNGGSGYPCQCQCSGDARNHASNFSLGSNSSEW